MLFSGGPASLTTQAGGLAGDSQLLPLSGQLASQNQAPAGFEAGSEASWVATQVVPDSMTLTTLHGRIVNKNALALVGTTLSIEARVFVGNGGGEPSSTPLSCVAAPAFTGIIVLGDMATFSCTGFSLPVAAGDTAFVRVSATAAALSLVNTINLQTTISLAGS